MSLHLQFKQLYRVSHFNPIGIAITTFYYIFIRKLPNVLGKIVKQICIGNIKRKNIMLKHKKQIKSKKNLIILRIGKNTSLLEMKNLVRCFSVTDVQKDMDVQRKSLRQINDRVVTLEKIMIDSHILLEKIRATVQQEDKSLPESQKFIHILSRESPYIYTNESRFPVTERHIPWKVNRFLRNNLSFLHKNELLDFI
jgi:hypothetical protein